MARYALRNKDKIADKLGKAWLDMLLATIKGDNAHPVEVGVQGGYKILEFTDATFSKAKHLFAVVGGMYDVVQLAYISSSGLK